jgi:hypothetical protein
MIGTRDPRHAAHSLLLLLGAVASAAPSLEAHEFGRFFDGLAAPLRATHRERPTPQRLPPGCDDAVERLAAEIDWLGHHLNAYGSVVAKEPDVWGQSRLMRHRHEYEALMRKQLGHFADRSQAAIRRSDQTFLSMVLALEQAADRRRSPDLALPAKPHEFAPLAPDVAGDGQPPALEPTIHLDHLSRYLNHLHELRRINEGDDSADAPGYALNLIRVPVSVLPGKQTHAGHGAEITFTAEPCLGGELLPATFRTLVINDLVDLVAPPLTCCVNDPECRVWAATIADAEQLEPPGQAALAAMHSLSRRLPTLAPSAAPAVKTRRARMPIPFSQLADASGVRQMAILIRDTHAALARHPANRPCIEYADVRGLLAEELEAAADFLAQPRQRDLWGEMPAWNLAELVRSRRTDELARIRDHVFSSFNAGVGQDEGLPATPVCRTTTAMLAWGILVESALLNERLVDDMREAAASRQPMAEALCGPFYGPDPGPEARAAFDDHVRRRWPIRVFALDPVTGEQNVEDAFTRRREMQVALAMAFASGRISAATMSRYARRLETDMATIALNKTAVGFSHGADTFGWRFYPRVQTPPTRNGLAAFSETLCGPAADADLAQRKLEPGQRECTAIIVMPSFVPAMTLDVCSRWFSLARPHEADRSMRQTMVLSRSVQAMRHGAAACSRAAHLYRDGEVARLLRAVEQLDRRLPLQTLHAQIPSENTCGGFELFTAGVTDLAPELAGWYGAPGIDPEGTTALFLVGKGFSVHDTTVIAGGKPVACTLISREVLRAEIPAGVATLPAAEPVAEPCAEVALTAAVEPLPAPVFPPLPEASACAAHGCDGREMVDIHLATPYGVSSHLLVPVSRRRTTSRCSLAFDPGFGIGLTFTTSKAAGGRSESAKVDEFFSATADAIVIVVPEAFVPPPKASLRLLVRDVADGTTAAAFSFDDLAFDVARRAYVIAGGDLRNFIGDTSRPATDKTLRGAVKPYLDNRLGRGDLAADGDDVAFTITAALVAEQREIAIGGSLAATAVRRGKTVVEPQAAEPPRED